MEKIYDDLQDLITKSLKAGTSETILTFSAVTALAGLLADKGLIEYDEFIQAFKKHLSEDEVQN